MGRVVVMNHLTLDGVMQGPGRPDEDTRGGFALGGWGSRSTTAGDAAGAAMGERMAAGGGLAGWLSGRWTYERLLSDWNDQGGPFKDALNKAPKYVASTILEEPLPWPNSTLLRGDVPAAVRALKAHVEGVLAVMGSGDLIRSLMAANLIDEYLVDRHHRASDSRGQGLLLRDQRRVLQPDRRLRLQRSGGPRSPRARDHCRFPEPPSGT